MEEINKNYLKKDLLKVIAISSILIIFLLILLLIDFKTKFILKLAEKIIDLLIK